MAVRKWTRDLILKVQKIAEDQNISEGAAAESLGYSAGAYSQGKRKAKDLGLLKPARQTKQKNALSNPLTFETGADRSATTDEVVTILVCRRSNVKKVLEGLWV